MSEKLKIRKWILQQLAAYAAVALLFFVMGLKITWWESADKVVYDCNNFLMFEDAKGNAYGCYKITGSRDRD